MNITFSFFIWLVVLFLSMIFNSCSEIFRYCKVISMGVSLHVSKENLHHFKRANTCMKTKIHTEIAEQDLVTGTVLHETSNWVCVVLNSEFRKDIQDMFQRCVYLGLPCALKMSLPQIYTYKSSTALTISNFKVYLTSVTDRHIGSQNSHTLIFSAKLEITREAITGCWGKEHLCIYLWQLLWTGSINLYIGKIQFLVEKEAWKIKIQQKISFCVIVKLY